MFAQRKMRTEGARGGRAPWLVVALLVVAVAVGCGRDAEQEAQAERLHREMQAAQASQNASEGQRAIEEADTEAPTVAAVTPCRAVTHYPPDCPFPFDAEKDGDWVEFRYDDQDRLVEQRSFSKRTGALLSQAAWTYRDDLIEVTVQGRRASFQQQFVRQGELVLPATITETSGPPAISPEFTVKDGRVIHSSDAKQGDCGYEYGPGAGRPFAISIFGQTTKTCAPGRTHRYEYDDDGRILKEQVWTRPPGEPWGSSERVYFQWIDFEYDCSS